MVADKNNRWIMKNMFTIKSLLIIVCVSLCSSTHGQNSYIGRLNGTITPPLYALETGCDYPTLTLNSEPIWLGVPLIVDGIEYFFGDTVCITGYLTPKWPGSNYFELEIETMKKWSLNQNNAQRFLGEYLLECECKSVFYEYSVTIKKDEGIESDLLIDIEMPIKYKDLKTFTFNDDFFIPRQENEGWSFRGGGEIRNDSLFLNFAATIFNWNCCDCKGKKADSTNIVSPPDPPQTKVHYDPEIQAIVIDKTLQNQSFTLELYDLQGRAVLRKSDVGATVNIADLPKGMYLYRVLENNRAACSGKILKNK